MGYQVTSVRDLDYDDLLLAVDRYLKLLRPGDISVVYYAGYAGERAASPRLLPADFAADKSASTIKLSQLMDDIVERSPRASVLLLDNTKLPSDQASTDPTQIALRPNTIVVTAFSSQALQARQRASSLFAQALTHHLERGEAIDTVMRAVADEVVAAGNKVSKQTQAVSVASALSTSYLQLSGTVPAKQVSLTDVANELAASCPHDAAAATDAAKTCLLEAKRLLSTQLAEIELQRHDDVERKVLTYRNSMLRSGMVRERWQMLWSDGWANAALLVICVLAMTLGDLLRDLYPGALRRYELERARLARSLIEQRYTVAKERVREALLGFPSGPLPGPRWHELRSYFDMDIAATPVHVPPFEPHGSADDFLDRLTWQAQHVQETP
jgi:hypothetical protein